MDSDRAICLYVALLARQVSESHFFASAPPILTFLIIVSTYQGILIVSPGG